MQEGADEECVNEGVHPQSSQDRQGLNEERDMTNIEIR